VATLAPPVASRTPARAAAATPTVIVRRPVPSWEFAGKTFYRTMDGKVIELPSDMSAEEVARLEAEARAAEQRLGKGPPPQPVPDVKVPAKPPKKEAPNRAGRRTAEGRGAAAAKAAAGVAALAAAVGKSKVAQYLAAQAAPVLARGAAMLSRLKRSEQTHDDAPEKLKQTEEAVVIPASEDQSKSNTGQVNTVGARPAPPVEERKAKATLEQSIADNMPRNIEDVDNFKRNKKAQHTGAEVLQVVQADKNAVVTTFNDLTATPPPAPAEHTPQPLPPEEPAPATPPMNLGLGAVPPFLREHVETMQYTKEADSKLKEEGVTQEQLDMVDSGDLAEANKEKKGLEQKAKAEPAAIQDFAKLRAEQVQKDLAQQEKTGRDALRARRRQTLGGTAQRQRGAKSALERKRDEVAAKINGIYQTAQDKVKKKLADLETQSMKRFDDGNAAATRAFEDSVKRELDAYKADRYSGWFGWARRAKDWLLGMDELPRVKQIFDSNRKTFVDTINALVKQISADNQRVIQECRAELDEARKQIKVYVDSLGPGLKAIGRQAANEMRSRLNDLDNTIGAKEEELRGQLKDKQTAAIKAIDEKIEKMKEAMSGALAKLGKLLLLAAKKFFTWTLEKFGFSLATIDSIINKGTAVLKAIFTGPVRFVKNLISAASQGFQSFAKNFLTHLKNAVFEWLTGSLEGVTLPASWDLKGILSVIFQLVGLTWQNIRAHLVKLIPEPVVRTLETGFALVKTLVTEGPMAAWEQLKDIGAELQDAFVNMVKDWIKWKVVQKAVETILAMFVPGAGIVRAVIAIYDTIVFFIQKIKEILRMVANFLGSIAEIAVGNIGAAAAALEEGLARGLKLVIAFLAKFLRLDGITARIRQEIRNIRARVDAVIEKVAKWIVGMAKKGGRLVAEKAGEIFSWAFAKTGFAAPGGKRHSIYIEGEDAPRLMIASDPKAAKAFVEWYVTEDRPRKKDTKAHKDALKAIDAANEVAKQIVQLKKSGAAWKDKQRELLEKNVAVGEALSTLIGDDRQLGKEIEKYKLEGLTGTYGSMPKPTGDDFTADHQPQAAILVAASKFRYFTPTGELVERAASRAKEGYAVNLHKSRHEAGRTYGAKGKDTKEAFLDRVKPKVKDKPAAQQRAEVVKLIRAELRSDVAAMKSVVRAAHDHANWKDVVKIAGKADAPKLITELRGRINAAEDQLVNQDLESLVD
jgi:hypothetical protein